MNPCSKCQDKQPKGSPCELNRTKDSCDRNKETAPPCQNKVSPGPSCEDPEMYELNGDLSCNSPKPCDKIGEPNPCDAARKPKPCDKVSGTNPCDAARKPKPCDKISNPGPAQKSGCNKIAPESCSSEPTIKTFFKPQKESYIKIFPASKCNKKPANLFNIGCNKTKPQTLPTGKCRNPIPGVEILGVS